MTSQKLNGDKCLKRNYRTDGMRGGIHKIGHDLFIILSVPDYSEPLNTGLSGIRMVIFRTDYKSGFRMVSAAILFFTIRKPDQSFF
jgi:hypothetical protein